MIEKLRWKFIMITMGSMLLVLSCMVFLINGVNLYRIDQRANDLLAVLAENNGRFPEKFAEIDRHLTGRAVRPEFRLVLTEETPFETRYFLVKGKAGNIGHININNVAAISADEAKTYGQQVLDSGKVSGYQGPYKFLVTTESNGDNQVIFVDCRSQLNSWWTLVLASIITVGLCFFAVLVLVVLLSRRVLAPIIDNMEKQKQFVMDAGHELKTPLAIIGANVDVLTLEQGENQWLESITRQVTRLDGLVCNLLSMAKMEDEKAKMVFSTFDLSGAMTDMTDTFMPLAEANGLQLVRDIVPGVMLNGDETAIRQMVSILLDNGVKYAQQPGEITIRLGKKERGGITLEVANVCDVVPEGDLDRLFDRFYRPDASRARQSGGYGIGLAVARTIVKAHKGKITARHEGTDKICFVVQL